MALEFAKPRLRVRCLAMMMPDANPVIEPLQRKVQIVVGLEFQHRKPSIHSHSEQVEHATIARPGNGRYLCVDVLWIEMR